MSRTFEEPLDGQPHAEAPAPREGFDDRLDRRRDDGLDREPPINRARFYSNG